MACSPWCTEIYLEISVVLYSFYKHFLFLLFSSMNLLQMKNTLLVGLWNTLLLQGTDREQWNGNFYIQFYLRMLIALCHGTTPKSNACLECFSSPFLQCQLYCHLATGLRAVMASNHCSPCSCSQALPNEATASCMHSPVLAAFCIFTNHHLEIWNIHVLVEFFFRNLLCCFSETILALGTFDEAVYCTQISWKQRNKNTLVSYVQPPPGWNIQYM